MRFASKSSLAAATIALVLAAVLPSHATTIRVPDEEPTIQAGIDAASHGDTVLVACGTYYEHIIIMKSGVYLTSETGQADCVTVDAQQQGNVFICQGVDDLASVVGLTITGGHGPMGGGMGCYHSSPTLTDCTFLGNHSDWGGGMECYHSSPTLTDCTFLENTAADGGGMHCQDYYSSPTLTGCTFSGNQAIDGVGGGMSCYLSSVSLTGCTFSGNQARSGGGMFCLDSYPTLTDGTFEGNQATYGGGICCWGSFPTLTRCIIAFSQLGEAVLCEDATSTPALTCCDVYGNAGGDWVDCITDQYGVNGNFSADPLFCLDANADEPYTLHEGSPCLPENSPCGELVGAFGLGCGPVSPVENMTWGAIKTMFR